MNGSMRAGVGIKSLNLPAFRLPGQEPRPLLLAAPQPAPPHPAPPHPDSLLGSVAATGHDSAGSPHAAEAAQVRGARDRHCGDREVLGATREIIQGRGRGEGIPSNTGGSGLLPTPRRLPAPLLPHPLPASPAQNWSRSSPGTCPPRSQLLGDWSTWRGLRKTPGLSPGRPRRFESQSELETRPDMA